MVAQSTLNKQANALISLYIQEFVGKYKRQPQINRYKSKWGFDAMVQDLTYETAQEVVKYYFRTERTGHDIAFLHNNYEKIAQFYKEKQEDEERRRVLREETRRRVEGLNG